MPYLGSFSPTLSHTQPNTFPTRRTILTACRGNSAATGVTTAATTQYTWLGNSTIVYNSTETNRQITWRTPGSLSKLYVRVLANSATSSSTVKVRKNLADPTGGPSVTIGAGATGVFEDSGHYVSIEDGDELDYQIITGTVGTLTIALISVVFDALTNTVSKHVMQGYSVTASATTHYVPIAGNRSGNTTTESTIEHTVKMPGTAKKASLLVTGTNTRTTDTTFTLRKNRVDTALMITVGAGLNGIFENTSDTVDFAADDEIDWEITSGVGTSEACQFQHIAFDYETTNEKGFISAGAVGSASDIVLSPSVTNYFVIGGSMIAGTTTEADAEMTARAAFKLKQLTVFSRTNTITAASTVKIRKNGADGNQSVTIGSSTTGFIVDTANVDTFDVGDTMSIQVVTGGTGTALTIAQLAVWTDTATNVDITKTVATETVTISEPSFVRLAAKTRAKSETVTISEGIARLVAKIRALAAQTVTIGESVVRSYGPLRTISQTVTITETSLARVLGKIRALSQTVVISEAVTNISGKVRALAAQTITIAEDVVRVVGTGGAQIEKTLSQTITIAEASMTRLKAVWRLQPP